MPESTTKSPVMPSGNWATSHKTHDKFSKLTLHQNHLEVLQKLYAPIQKHQKASKNCQNQLCQNAGKQSSLQQLSECLTRKMPLQKGRKVLWHFYLPFTHLLPSASAILAYIPCVGCWSLVPKNEVETLFVNDCVCSNLPGLPDGLTPHAHLCLELRLKTVDIWKHCKQN